VLQDSFEPAGRDALCHHSGILIATGGSLDYYFNKNGQLQKSMNKAFMPAGMVKAMYL
jgi:hypothetical protein